MSKSLSTSEVREVLRKRYAAPEWALLEEVRNATGFSNREERYADALAMNLYPSRGLSILGFEIKTARGDWLRELKSPDKSVPIQKYTDYWWVVAGGSSIVQKDEVPDAWGLMVYGNGRMNIVKDAPKLASQALDRGFVASMMRRMNEYVSTQLGSAEAIQEAFNKGKAEAESGKSLEQRRLESDVRALRDRINHFEEETGVQIDRWSYGNLREVLKDLQAHAFAPKPDEALQRAKGMLESSLKYLQAMEMVQALTKKDEPALRGVA